MRSTRACRKNENTLELNRTKQRPDIYQMSALIKNIHGLWGWTTCSLISDSYDYVNGDVGWVLATESVHCGCPASRQHLGLVPFRLGEAGMARRAFCVRHDEKTGEVKLGRTSSLDLTCKGGSYAFRAATIVPASYL